MKKVKTAVLGYGHLGKWHVEKAIQHESCDLLYVIDPSLDSKSRLHQAHPEVAWAGKFEEIIDQVDAIIIATPTSLHFDLIKEGLEKGKHIFCEKPMCSNIEELKKIEELKVSSDRVFQVGHSERFHQVWEDLSLFSPFLKGKSLIQLTRVAPFKGRATDVDVVQDLMIHDIDLLLMLLNEDPKTLKTSGFKIRTKNWDHVQASFEFDSGKHALIESSRNACRERRMLTITNEAGQIQVDLMERKVFIAKSQTTDVHVETFEYEKRDHLFLEQDEFYQAILKESSPSVGFYEGAKAVEIVDRVLKDLQRDF